MSFLSTSQEHSFSSSYFKDIVSKVGIKLQSDSPIITEKDQELIIRDLQKELEKHANYPRNIPDFISGVKCFCRSRNLFKLALQQSEFHQSGNEDSRVLQQGSLFKILLSIDAVQKDIISILLDEITYHADDEEEIDWVRLIIQQLLFLPYISDSKNLTIRLLEILEMSKKLIQIELIGNISFIISDNDHDEVAKKLSLILNRTIYDNDFTCAVIKCLSSLNLSDDAKSDIEVNIIKLLYSTNCLITFSSIFQYLVTNCKPVNLSNILLKVRNALDSIMGKLSNDENNRSGKLLTFEGIKSITRKESVGEAWIQLISNMQSAKDHKSVDIILLILFHQNRKNIVENIFKKKVKNLHLQTSFLKKSLEQYLVPQILKDHIESILEISEFLLRTNDPLCTEFATTFCSVTFGHRNTDAQQRHIITQYLISLDGNDKIKSQKLRVFRKIADENLELLQMQAMQLMNLLKSTVDCELGDVKQIYELLTNLTCWPKEDSSMEAFQNMIFIIVKKQLGANKNSLKYSGIIGAISVAKNIAVNLVDDGEQSNMSSDVSYSSIADLPFETARQAANLLKEAMTSSETNPLAQMLCYDQLAQMVFTTENLDKCFLAWLQDTITNNFQEIYITSDAPKPIDGIPLQIQYNLNSKDEINEPVYIKISELTINASENNSTMLVFAPLFRLLRLITCRQNDTELSTIDAVLGCGVILPEIDPDIGIESYDSKQIPQVINCIFHCINWFREIINAFVTQKHKKLKERVLKRLGNLVELEEIFVTAMKNLPEHKLPPSYFYNANLNKSAGPPNLDKTKPINKGRKRKAPGTENTQALTCQSTQATTVSRASKKTTSTKEKKVPIYNFREMDIDIILLLKYPLITTADSVPEDKLCLTFPEYKFILRDLITKLNTVTKASNINVFSHLITVEPINLITDCVRLLPFLNTHLIKIIDETKKILEKSDGIHDSHNMFLQEATELKICFELNLEIRSLVLSWVGFQMGKNVSLLRECLRAIVDDEKISQQVSSEFLILEYLKYIPTLSDYCLTLASAVHLINIVKALCSLSKSPVPKEKLVLISGKLLSTKWFNIHGLPESGAVANLHIETLVKAHLNNCSLLTISSIVSWIQIECNDLKSKNDNLKTFPPITKSNFPILYREACTSLLEAVKNEIHGKTNHQHLNLWMNVAATMRNLMEIVKIQDSKTNLVAFLKRSMGIIKVFQSQGLPILKIMLRSNMDTVVEILHTLQRTTRFIHNLCCHSKMTNDNVLMNHVPQMRMTLETLVYRVKAALVENNCSAGFWMGTLKNRNLQGEEIIPPSLSSTTESQDDEDELPVDEESDEESMRSAKSEGDISSVV